MPETELVKVRLKVKRFDPESDRKPYWQEFDVEVEETDRVLDALHAAKWYHDGTLSFRRSCAHGVCGSDAMVINGENALACVLLIREAGATSPSSRFVAFRSSKISSSTWSRSSSSTGP